MHTVTQPPLLVGSELVGAGGHAPTVIHTTDLAVR
jgi:hypothetical protein